MKKESNLRIIRWIEKFFKIAYFMAWIAWAACLMTMIVATFNDEIRSEFSFVSAPFIIEESAGQIYFADQFREIKSVMANGLIFIDDAPVFLPMLNLSIYLIITTLVLYATRLILYFLRTFRQGDYFKVENAYLIRKIALIFLATNCILLIFQNFFFIILPIKFVGHQNLLEYRWDSVDLNFELIIWPLIFLAVSEVIRAGAELKQENELTI